MSSAFELFYILVVISCFAQMVYAQVVRFTHAVGALFVVTDLVEAMQLVALGLTPPARIRGIVSRLIRSCQSAGWEDCMIPKFHWLLHYAKHLERWGSAISCFVHERKHRMIKRYAQDIRNTGFQISAYASSVLHEVMSHQMWAATSDSAFMHSMGLIEPKKAKAALQHFVLLNMGLADATVMTSMSVFVRRFCMLVLTTLFCSQQSMVQIL